MRYDDPNAIYDTFIYDLDVPPDWDVGVLPVPLGNALDSGPIGVRLRTAERRVRIYDADFNLITQANTDPSGRGLIEIDGSITETDTEMPREEGSIHIVNPEGKALPLFEQGMVIMVEDELSYPNGKVYKANSGRLGITKVHAPRTQTDRSITIDVMNSGQIILDFSLEGDLTILALPYARTLGLVAADNKMASVEGIMAYVLFMGGATGIGIEGGLTPTPAWTKILPNGKVITPFALAGELDAQQIMARCIELSGVTYWVDWDGTAILKAKPKDVFDLVRDKIPRWSWAFTGDDAQVVKSDPSPGIPLNRIALYNQATTAATRIVAYAVPDGSSIPLLDTAVATGGVKRGRYKRFDAGAFPSPADDPSGAQDRRAQQLALDLALRSNEVSLDVVPVPFAHAGDLARLNFPDDDAVGVYYLKQRVWQLGRGPMRFLAQRIFPPDQPGSGTVGTTPYIWADKVPRLSLSPAYGLSPRLAYVQSWLGSERYHGTPYTYEGWLRLAGWPKKASGANLTFNALFTTDAEAKFTDRAGDPTNMDCTVYLYGETPGTYGDPQPVVATIGPFVVGVADAVHRHWALQREAGWAGIWRAGTLMGSVTNAGLGLTRQPGMGRYDLTQNGNVGLMQRPYNADASEKADAATVGDIAFFEWRYKFAANYPHANFAPPAAYFADMLDDYPKLTISVWPFLGLDKVTWTTPSGLPGTTPYIGANSTMSDAWAQIPTGLIVPLGGVAPPF